SVTQDKPETCGNDGYASALADGGAGSFTYLWNTGQSLQTIGPLSAGTYTVTVSDINGCSKTASGRVYAMGHGPVTTIPSQLVCHEITTVDFPLKVSFFNKVGGFNFHLRYDSLKLSAPTMVAGSLNPAFADWNRNPDSIMTVPIHGLIIIGDDGPRSNLVSLPDGSTIFILRFNILSGTTTSTITFDDGPLGGYCEYIGYTPDGVPYPFCDKPLDQYYIPGVVTVNPLLTAVISAHSNVLCNGGNTGSATVSAGGGTSGYKYLWNNTQTTPTAINLTAGTYTVTVTDANTCTATATVSITQPSVLTAVISNQVDVLCHGNTTGSATVSVSGGTTAYTYLWNTIPAQHAITATGLTAASYTVTVTDANTCVTTASVTITEPATLVATIINNTPVRCFGGSDGKATVSASGGTTGYTYIWNTIPPQYTDVASGLIVGVYTVTVTDANTCSATASVQISQPAALSISATHENVTCFGGNNGSFSVTASGGSTPYSYLWSDGLARPGSTATGLTVGSYTVTVTDFCSAMATASALITQPAEITVNAGASQYLCQQTYTVLYGDPQTGLWSQDSPVSPLVSFFPIPGTNMTLVMGLPMLDAVPYIFKYTVTVGPCSKSDTMKVFNYHYPSMPYAGPDQNLCWKASPDNYVRM
ncbi:MAG: SprB repeat-containing protein, partial [Bacteroidota bacterium]